MKQAEGDQAIREKTERLTGIYQQFNDNIQQFAQKYKHQINHDPLFRKRFNDLCLAIGIDPIVSRKSLFTGLGFGDFYNQLAMKVLDICARQRAFNGGLMAVDDIISYYQRTYRQKIDAHDIAKSIDTLKVLGNGCSLFKQQYVCTVPFQLSQDTSTLMAVAEQHGMVTASLLAKTHNWDAKRFQEKIEFCLKKGLVWVDRQGQEHSYYFASMMGAYVHQTQPKALQ